MNKVSAAIVEVEQEIADLRDGRGCSRAGTVNLLRRVLDALWEPRMSEESDKRHTIVAGMLPPEWDRKPFGLAGEIRTLLASVKDAGTEIDSASGDGCADLWVTVQGVEYYINVRKSNKQLVCDGKLPAPSNSL